METNSGNGNAIGFVDHLGQFFYLSVNTIPIISHEVEFIFLPVSLQKPKYSHKTLWKKRDQKSMKNFSMRN